MATSSKLVEGLKKRQPAGLRRPKKTIEGVGEIERVRTDGLHSWQYTLSLVPTRRTTVDEVLQHDDPDESVVKTFVDSLNTQELKLRKQFAQERYPELCQASSGTPFPEQLSENLDSWLSPFLVVREPDGCYIEYDCLDAVDGRLAGNRQFRFWIDEKWEFKKIETLGNVGRLARVAAFKSRIIPANCGYVEDCVADRIICCGFVSKQKDLVDPLIQSIDQVSALLQAATTPQARTFLTAALYELKTTREEWEV